MLAHLGRKLQEALIESAVVKVFRYVVHFLLIFLASPGSSYKEEQSIFRILSEVFSDYDPTKEDPANGELQFLDLRLHISRRHVCWTYSPHSKKELHPYSSAHSKLLNCAVATSALKNALNRSREYTVQPSFESQIQRLRSAGYPDQLETW